MIDHYIPKVGDRVGSYHGYGIVTRVTKGRLTIKLDHGGERVIGWSKYAGFRVSPESDEVRARRAWETDVPRGLKHAWISMINRSASVRAHGVLETADDVRAAARELEAIADWLDRRPEGS